MHTLSDEIQGREPVEMPLQLYAPLKSRDGTRSAQFRELNDVDQREDVRRLMVDLRDCLQPLAIAQILYTYMIALERLHQHTQLELILSRPDEW